MSFDIQEIRAANPLEIVAGHYTKLTKNGNEWRGACPIHGGDNPSAFAVYTDKNGVQRFACYTRGCHENENGTDVIAFIQAVEGLEFKAACEFLGGKAKSDWKPRLVMPERPKPQPWQSCKPPAGTPQPDMELTHLGKPSQVWPVKDADGEALGYVARYETKDGKEIRCWTWGSEGAAAKWACRHFTKPRPLVGLDVLAERPSDTVVIVEGEKAREAAEKILPRNVIVSWLGGAQAWRFADFAPLRGRRIRLWPDADEPGLKAMRSVGSLLKGIECE